GSAWAVAHVMADISHWFTRRRGIAVAVCSSGNYLGGAVWPPVVRHFIETEGWRQNQLLIGIICVLTMLPLLLVLRRRLECHELEDADTSAAGARARLGLNAYVLLGLLA